MYDVAPDGQSIFATQPARFPTEIHLVSNWLQELEATDD